MKVPSDSEYNVWAKQYRDFASKVNRLKAELYWNGVIVLNIDDDEIADSIYHTEHCSKIVESNGIKIVLDAPSKANEESLQEYRVIPNNGSPIKIAAFSPMQAKTLAERDGYRVKSIAANLFGSWEIVWEESVEATCTNWAS